MPENNRFWETKSLEEMSRAEWESLCDGCAQCCLHKLQDDETDQIYYTDVACKLLDTTTCRCKHYALRRRYVPDCVSLKVHEIPQMSWLPTTCAYRLLSEGKPLFDWHPLISGHRETVHSAGVSVLGRCISEIDVKYIEDHIIER